ncbi:MAG: hypothetical protein MH825_15475 [Cyanobacteria bacterium]|nr:hypothetical protein [Cyanobacteriota bacterium]
MASVVLSFIGNQDPYSNQTKEEGSLITLLRFLVDRGTAIARVFLLYTEGTAQNARDTKDHIETEAQLQGLAVELLPTSADLSQDPTDLLKAAQEARRGLEAVKLVMAPGDRVEFNASSGTPAMKSAFSLLQAAGYAGNGQVWQVRNPQQMREGQDRVFPTDVTVLRHEFDLQILRKLIGEFDYQAALDLLQSLEGTATDRVTVRLLTAAAAWNRGKFDEFFQQAKGQLDFDAQRQGAHWWWQGYEQAFSAVVRLAQGNTTEALQHSHRSVEGMVNHWAIVTFPDSIKSRPNGYAIVLSSILDEFPSLRDRYEQSRDRSSASSREVNLQGYLLRDLLEVAIPSTRNQADFAVYWQSAREARNQASHRWGGISKEECFGAWRTQSQEDWEQRLLNCLNLISGQTFGSLKQASLLTRVHQRILDNLAQPRLS